MSPWPMMNEWGIPTFYLQALVYEFAPSYPVGGRRCQICYGRRLSTEDGVFKSIAHGRALRKRDMHGPALMIPGMVGKNIGKWLEKGELPASAPSTAAAGGDISSPTRIFMPVWQ